MSGAGFRVSHLGCSLGGLVCFASPFVHLAISSKTETKCRGRKKALEGKLIHRKSGRLATQCAHPIQSQQTAFHCAAVQAHFTFRRFQMEPRTLLVSWKSGTGSFESRMTCFYTLAKWCQVVLHRKILSRHTVGPKWAWRQTESGSERVEDTQVCECRSRL